MSRVTVGPFRNGRNAVDSAHSLSSASLDGMPIEIKKMIFDYLAPCDEYTAIRDLCQLRLANRSFAETLAPRVFRTFTFWMEPDSLGNLNAISEHPILCHYFQRLVFYPAQLSDKAQQPEYRETLKDRIDRNSHTHNDSELRLIRYLANYARALEAQKMLFTDETAVKLLARIFRHLPNMQGLDIFTGRSYVGGAKLTRSFEDFNPADFDYSGKNTLRSLSRALFQAPMSLHGLGFITNRMLCPNGYDGNDCNLVFSSLARENRRRSDFTLIAGDVWTDNSIVNALPSALRGWLAFSLLDSLRDFRLCLDSNYRVLTGGESEYGEGLDGDLYKGLNKVFKHARNLERLEFGLNCDCYHGEFYDCGLESGLDVGAVFKNAWLAQLKHVELRHCEPKEPEDVHKLFRMCAGFLEVVYIEDAFANYGSWRGILQRLKKQHQFPSLKRFNLYDIQACQVYNAGPYLQGLEARDPMTEQLKDL